jgi:hypothetical protein
MIDGVGVVRLGSCRELIDVLFEIAVLKCPKQLSQLTAD